jgi:hypothetical protein
MQKKQSGPRDERTLLDSMELFAGTPSHTLFGYRRDLESPESDGKLLSFQAARRVGGCFVGTPKLKNLVGFRLQLL